MSKENESFYERHPIVTTIIICVILITVVRIGYAADAITTFLSNDITVNHYHHKEIK